MEKLNSLLKNNQISIVDGMIDWVRVIGKDNIVAYANKKMKDDLDQNIVGKMCYEVFGRTEKCETCISNETITSGKIMRKETEFKDKVFAVISSPMYDENNEIKGSVEVFRDITTEKEMATSINQKNKKMSDDINFAKNMQKRMLPPKGTYNGVYVDYLYEASEMLSGDFFDIYKIDDHHTGIYMCDVVGHGITASLLTMFVRQSLRTISKNVHRIDRLIKELHKTFLGLNLDYDKYFSVFMGIYNNKTKEFKYINAGHNSIPILVSDNEIIMLEAKGYPICNIFDSVDYDVNNIQLKEKDKIFFYTDGITEAKNENGQEYDLEKLIEIIKSEDNILDRVKESLDRHQYIQKDDYAMLMVEII